MSDFSFLIIRMGGKKVVPESTAFAYINKSTVEGDLLWLMEQFYILTMVVIVIYIYMIKCHT